MYQTVQVTTCVSAQGELVERLPNGEAIIRDGANLYRGRALSAEAPAPAARREATRVAEEA